MIAPLAKLARAIDLNEEVGMSETTAVEEGGLIDDVVAAPHRFGRPLDRFVEPAIGIVDRAVRFDPRDFDALLREFG